ncbi:MAG: carboxypeptidase-like regulatory domain-containing protein, partial [Cytophagales bacterium]|nr:carboxypeptidase-like regulatory domain-containing protein [Cytophagales bacterium]
MSLPIRTNLLVLVFAFFLAVCPTLAQQPLITITGSVLDQETAQPIAFAHVGVASRSIGTVSNAEGNFVLKVPAAYRQDSLQVSVVGYRSYTRLIAALPEGAITISLQPAIIELAEVQVRAKGLTGLEIIKAAIAAIPVNYDTSAYQMLAFYREDTKLDDYQITFLESVLEVNRPSVAQGEGANDQIKTLKERRKQIDHSKDVRFYLFLTLGGGAQNALKSGNYRPKAKEDKHSMLNKRNFKHYDFRLSSIISDGTRKAYVIEVRPKKKNGKALMQGKVYIDVASLAFTQWKLEGTPRLIELENNRNALLKGVAAIINKANVKFSGFKQTFRHELYQGKWYVKDIQRHMEARVNSKSRNMQNSLWQTDLFLTVTDIKKGNGTAGQQIYSSADSLSRRLNDADFWGNFNIIQPTGKDTIGTFEPQADTLPVKKTSQFNPVKPSNRVNGFTRADTLRGKLTPLRTCYDVTFYDLTVTVDIDAKSISGSNSMQFRVLEPFSRMQIDLYANLQIHQITCRGQALPYTRECNAVFIQFPEKLPLHSRQEITIRYGGKPKEPNWDIPMDGGFLWQKDAAGNPWVQVVCQGSGASLWWPNKDHLSDEPDSVRLAVTVPDGLMCIANGRLRRTTPLSGKQTRYEWFVSYPINNYNLTLNIGKYAHLQDHYVTTDTLTLDYYVMPYHLEKGKIIFDRVKPMLTLLESQYGKYPFPRDGFKLMESLYPMEHQSAVSFGKLPEGEVRDSLEVPMRLVWHEVSHEWWGNNVSCRDLADMWIHEAFATYSESLPMKAQFGLQGGGYAEYARTRPNQCIKLPTDLSLADGAIIEPLAVA